MTGRAWFAFAMLWLMGLIAMFGAVYGNPLTGRLPTYAAGEFFFALAMLVLAFAPNRPK